jgi:hypothetical protein
MGILPVFSLLACGHAAVQVGPGAAATAEDAWNAQMERRHEGFAAKPWLALHEIALEPRPGFVQLPVSDRSRYRKDVASDVLHSRGARPPDLTDTPTKP